MLLPGSSYNDDIRLSLEDFECWTRIDEDQIALENH